MAALRRLVAGGGQAFVDFLRSARERLDHCLELAAADAPPKGEILRHLHTMKGEARAFELRELASHLGALEDRITERADGGVSSEIAEGMREGLAVLDRAQRVLVEASPLGEGALDAATVSRRDLRELVKLAGRREDDLGKVVRRLASRPFGEAATILVQQVPTWAEVHNKRARVRVEGREVLVPPELARVLGGVLSHLVRNAIAHGIESPGHREQSGKDATGEIVLRCSDGPAGPVIVVEDDGQGLSEERIVERAKELGVYTAGVDPASLVFHPGLSTLGEKTELAGLGVGLAAARADLASAGYGAKAEKSVTGGARFVLGPAETSS